MIKESLIHFLNKKLCTSFFDTLNALRKYTILFKNKGFDMIFGQNAILAEKGIVAVCPPLNELVAT